MSLQQQSRQHITRLLLRHCGPYVPVILLNHDKALISGLCKRAYAKPARFNLPAKIAFKPPPPPASPSLSSVEEGHEPGEIEQADGPFDKFLEDSALKVYHERATSVATLHSQYRDRNGKALDYVIPYEEKPAEYRRADRMSPRRPEEYDELGMGDGLVMVVYALKKSNDRLGKICACSGFVVDAKPTKEGSQSHEMIISCAHTLEQMHRIVKKASEETSQPSFAFIIDATGGARPIQEVSSSMPRSDLVAMQLEAPSDPEMSKLRSLPISPFPVYPGSPVLTHLFGTSIPPFVTRSSSRLPKGVKQMRDHEVEQVQMPINWLLMQAWRRWGSGVMLGYRSYTGIEVEAGIHSSLPHILTSVLPTPGSSGGPLVCAETGAVVGMISGRRMDNRVEGERGWGASAESIFEVIIGWVMSLFLLTAVQMFSLPGFSPANGGK